ncbi:MAG: phosphohydrolase [Desulfamplus sp.]|nr:phosphohydrolase [Desulfamplus sp.]
MDPKQIIREYYRPGTKLYDIFMAHAENVTKKSIDIALRIPHLNPDTSFIEEAAMLHDIGIFMTNSPSIHCMGEHPYVCHGILGRELLDSLKFPCHALVCERHTGAGITRENIMKNSLPLPCRDMVPVTVEEEIICFSDKFYSKNPDWTGGEKSISRIMDEMLKLDISHYERFAGWVKKFLI